ncbi:MAG: mechanosensitive ion channel [Candidatus Igneacidithiobacillus chanchocoensis]
MDYMHWTSLLGNAGYYVPRIIGAIAILIIGWLVAVIFRGTARLILQKLHFSEKLKNHAHISFDLAGLITGAIYWIVILFALIAAFNLLNLHIVADPLRALAAEIMVYLPRLFLAAILGVVAWVLGSVARNVVTGAVRTSKIEAKLGAGTADTGLSKSIGDIAFWLIILLFLPAIVGTLQVHGLLTPFTDMIRKILTFLPNVIAAAFLGGIGYLVAKILSKLVTSILGATRVDTLLQSASGTSELKISQLAGTLVFVFVFIPTLIAAIQALQIEVVARPAEHMLQLFLTAVPNIVAAALIIIIAWFIGRFVANMLTQLLSQLGFNRFPEYLGLKAQNDGSSLVNGKKSPSAVVGQIALWFIMAFAFVAASRRLGFDGVTDLFHQLIVFSAQVLFGLVILAVGQWLSSLAAKLILQLSGDNSVALARIARIAILGLVMAMGLRAMGFANSIVDLAFGLVLGSVAVAVALAFGLGGREAAGKIAEHWTNGYLASKKDKSQHPSD